MPDIDAIVEETVKETVVKTEEAPAEATTTQETADAAKYERMEKENERLKKANKTLNEKLKNPEPKEEVIVEEPVVDPADPLATREGWLNEIDTRAKALVAPIYEANFRRASDRFVKLHPEYSQSKEKLKVILETAKTAGKMDEEDILDSMGRAWASTNWRELQAETLKKESSRSRAQAFAMNAASPSEGSPNEDEFSEEEREEAAKFGKSVESYRKAKALLEKSSIQVT